MSFAAGLVAGQRAAQGAIDAFTQTRGRRNERRFNEDMAALEAERQGRMQGLGPQASPVEGRVDPLTNQPIPVQSPAPQQGVGLVDTPTAAPANPMSTSEYFQRQAALAGKHNLTDRAERYMAQGLQAQQIEDQQARFDRRLAQQADQFDQRIGIMQDENLRDKELHEKSMQEATIRLEQLGVERGNQKFVIDFMEKHKGKPFSELINSPEYTEANQARQMEIAKAYAGATTAHLEAASAQIAKDVDQLNTFDELVSYVDREQNITPDTSLSVLPDEKGEGLTLQFFDSETGELEREWKFKDQAQADSWLRVRAKDPSSAGMFYSTQRANTAKAIAENQKAMFDRNKNIMDFVQDQYAIIYDPENIAMAQLSAREREAAYLHSLRGLTQVYGMTMDQIKEIAGGLPKPKAKEKTGGVTEAILDDAGGLFDTITSKARELYRDDLGGMNSVAIRNLQLLEEQTRKQQGLQ